MMDLRTLSSPVLAGHMFPGVRQQYYKLKGSCGFKLQNDLTTVGRRFYQCMNSNVRCSAEDVGVSTSYSGGLEKDSNVASSDISLYDARVLYCVAPAMGHNKESHPESNKRVPAIIDALERLELTPKYRSSVVFEAQNFRPASIDDIANVHARAYVAGLEKEIVNFQQTTNLRR